MVVIMMRVYGNLTPAPLMTSDEWSVGPDKLPHSPVKTQVGSNYSILGSPANHKTISIRHGVI